MGRGAVIVSFVAGAAAASIFCFLRSKTKQDDKANGTLYSSSNE
jgi:hypothetical protein